MAGDDIERLKIHKITPRTTSDHVFLPVSDVPHPPTDQDGAMNAAAPASRRGC